MIRIGEIDHVVLRAIDVAAMQRFYCEVLGCREERRQDEIGLVQLRFLPLRRRFANHGRRSLQSVCTRRSWGPERFRAVASSAAGHAVRA
jgi:catechol 2,3-dioxygenase-like lactoylglutathione lyase family enzyme